MSFFYVFFLLHIKAKLCLLHANVPALVFLKGKSSAKDTNSFGTRGFAKGIMEDDGPQGQAAEQRGGLGVA